MCRPALLILAIAVGPYCLHAAPSAPSMPARPSGLSASMGGGAVNDHCGDVVPEALAIGATLTFAGDNTNATFDGDSEPGTVLTQFPSPNTWHAFTISDCADVTVSYCGTNAGWTNVWTLLTTDCPADSVIFASSSEQTTCANGNWTFTFSSLAPGTYYLPVPNVGFGQGGGAYSVEVSADWCATGVPANDLCGNVTPQALAIGATLTFVGDNTNATFAGDSEPGTVLGQFPSPNTWHAFTLTDCAAVTVSYCGTNAGWTNVWTLLTTDCPADSVIFANSSEQTTCANGNWTFTFSSLAPGTYYLPVPNVGFGQGGGVYSVEVSADWCATGVPTNDLCGSVTPANLAVGSTLQFVGSNTNATFAGDAVPGTVMAQFPSPNTWHAFTTTECADVTVSYCGTNSGWSNVWKLLAVDCPADSLIQATLADTTTCANGNWNFWFNDLAAGTYYLPVPNVSFGQGGGPYNISVSAVNCVSSGIGSPASPAAGWTLFPNPATGTVSLNTTADLGAAVVELIDMTGRTLHRENLVLGAGATHQFNFTGVAAPGTYLVAITQAEGRSIRRLVLR